MKFLKLLVVGLVFISSSLFAEVAIIVHPSNTGSIDETMISRIFTGKAKSFPSGGKAIPINQTSGAAITEDFNKKALKKSSSQLKAYWSKLVFTGKGTPPKEVSNDAEMIELISANPNLIGYVDKSSVTGDVRVIASF